MPDNNFIEVSTEMSQLRARCNSASEVSILWTRPTKNQSLSGRFEGNKKQFSLHSGSSLIKLSGLYLEVSRCKNPTSSHSSDMAINIKPSDPVWGLERDLQLLASSKDTTGTTHSSREPSIFHSLGENEVCINGKCFLSGPSLRPSTSSAMFRV